MNATLRSVRNLPRYQEIIRVFIKHGFGFIFESLSSEMLRPLRFILRSQATKTDQATIEDLAIHLRLALEELGPTFVKLGQILSMRSDFLPAAYCEALTRLRTQVEPMPYEQVEAILEGAYGHPLQDIFASFDQSALGSASIAQVHSAELVW